MGEKQKRRFNERKIYIFLGRGGINQTAHTSNLNITPNSEHTHQVLKDHTETFQLLREARKKQK